MIGNDGNKLSPEAGLGFDTVKPSLQNGYAWQIGFIYVFNLVVGAGALALPRAFAQAGWILGLAALGALALMSYCTSTFMVEAMSIANAVLRCKSKEVSKAALEASVVTDQVEMKESNLNGGYENDDTQKQDVDVIKIAVQKFGDDELYEITDKVEMGEMATMFYNKFGLILYYIVIGLYLYGDLAIYAAAVPKSMTTLVCGKSDIFDHNVELPCGKSMMKGLRIIDMYRIMLCVFSATLCPFVFFNLSKTKFLQIFTTIFRWAAFIGMVVLACLKIANRDDEATPHHVKLFDFDKLPNFFGVAVYSFMCQHSLPSILTPITDKRRLNVMVLFDFILVAIFYCIIVLTAVFAFPANKIEDLYTLNFTTPVYLKYFLELFPIVTLSTTFPIIAITLRENLKTLLLKNDEKEYGLFVRRYCFPLLTVAPPIAIAYATYDVGLLVSITGTYAGAIIQYVIPVTLVYYGRIYMKKTYGNIENKFRSPFRRRTWIFLVLAWYVICFVFVTYNIIKSKSV